MITAIVQARMGSTRLPAKVMLKLARQPLIAHVLTRAQAAKRIEQVILATTTDAADNPLAEFVAMLGVPVFRGSQEDVLDRYYQAAKTHNASVIVRLTGDCPMLDPQVIDQTLGLFLSGEYDYVSNCMLHRTFPDGLDTEVFSFAALEKTWQAAQLKSEREHVTPYLYKNPQIFHQAGLINAVDLSHYRWTVDEPADFEFVTRVFEELYGQNPLFGMESVAELLERKPELLAINQGIATNEGYLKSLFEEQQVPFNQELLFALHEMRSAIYTVKECSDLLSQAMNGELDDVTKVQKVCLDLLKSASKFLKEFIDSELLKQRNKQ